MQAWYGFAFLQGFTYITHSEFVIGVGMAQTFGKNVGRTALFLAAGLVLLVLFGASIAPADDGESSVRMAVDPTVLPPVLPPDGLGDVPSATPPEAAPAPDALPAKKTSPGRPTWPRKPLPRPRPRTRNPR